MAKIIKLKKGLDIPLYGNASAVDTVVIRPDLVGIVPDDFPGYTWKPLLKEGESVAKGAPLMSAKENPEICLVSPVGGAVGEIRRGKRRKILAVTVIPAAGGSEIGKIDCGNTPEQLISALCVSGLWALMRQRPFDIIPNPKVSPRDIFITAFDSAPLAPEIVNPSDFEFLEIGIKALKTLTSGKVYLDVRYGSGISSASAEVTEFAGPHPAGNVGVQIANISPVNKGETVWALDAATVVKIGHLVRDGVVDTSAVVAITGPEVKTPRMVSTVDGASVSSMLEGNLRHTEDIRIISGNVLTGHRVDMEDGFLRYPYRQITVIREGANADEFMGWASVSPKKFSVKHSFPAFLRGLSRPFDFDSRIKGGHRAMIVSGEYDKVFPMDIYPEYLLKAIMAKDIDRMEKLGIYEVAPEDFALSEFVDTSKLPLQQIVADGLDYLRKEL